MTLHEAIIEFKELIGKAKADLTPVQYGVLLGSVLNEVGEALGDAYTVIEVKKGIKNE